MPTNSDADLPQSTDDYPLDARSPEGALPTQRLADVVDTTSTPSTDPADAIPVPIVMSPAEIDERAQAVEAVRTNRGLEPQTEV